MPQNMSVSAAATRRKQREQPTNCRQGVMLGQMSGWVRCGQAGLKYTKIGKTFEEVQEHQSNKQMITSLRCTDARHGFQLQTNLRAGSSADMQPHA